MPEFVVYGLYALWPSGTRDFFYVGQTQDLKRRMKEHEYGKRYRHEDVYECLREMEAMELPWHAEILELVGGDVRSSSAERDQVVRMIRAGHELRNMRHGMVRYLAKRAETDEKLAEALETLRLRREGAGPSTRSQEWRQGSGGVASRKLRREVLRQSLEAMLRTGKVRDLAACTELRALAPVTHRRLVKQAHEARPDVGRQRHATGRFGGVGAEHKTPARV